MAASVPLVGEVVGFDERRGLGTVRGPDGREWLFHCTRIADGTRTVAIGTAVVFEIAPGRPGGWEATGLVKLT
ncbi:MAG: hypothetical protein NVSMB12_01840 [Acidimicrobiales bacterium]